MGRPPVANANRTFVMGLEIFYDLHAPEAWSDDDARAAVEMARSVAATQGFAEIDSTVRRLGPTAPHES